MVLFLQDNESKGTENIWIECVFFSDQRAESTILKANFPENTLVYVNQDFVVVGQLIPSVIVDPNINYGNYEYKQNKVMLFVPVYNTWTGLYDGFTRELAYITLLAIQMKDFGFTASAKKRVLYSIVP